MYDETLRAYELEPGKKGHKWETYDFSGDVNIFAADLGDYCNGPKCVNCGYYFCHHCQELPEKSCPLPDSSSTEESTI